MRTPITGISTALAGLALLAPAAHAENQVVENPAPGVTSVSLSDQTEPGNVLVQVTAPVSAGHVSSLFFDTDGDGAADRAIVATQPGPTAGTVRVLATPGSTTSCQQVGGTSASPVPGATASLNSDGSGWSARVPAAQLPGTVRWKVTATADARCGGTDDSVDGLALDLLGGSTFKGSTQAPPADTTAPAAPSALTVAPGDGRAAIDWADNGESDLAGYLVYRRTAGGAFTLVASPGSSALTDTGLVNGTAYEYYVRAKDTAGNLSGESVKVLVTPVAPSKQPVPKPVEVPKGIPPVVVPPVVVKPPVVPPKRVPGPPRGARKLGAVSAIQLVGTRSAAGTQTFSARTGKVSLGLLYNGASVASTVSARFTVAVRTSRRGAARTRAVVVGTATVKLRPGQSLPLRFTLNKAGRKLVKSKASLRIGAALTVKVKGARSRTGTLKVTVKKTAPKAPRHSTKTARS